MTMIAIPTKASAVALAGFGVNATMTGAAVMTKSRCIGENEFSALYSAADFATEFDMWMDTSVTVCWSLFGITGDTAVQSAFMSFTKCLRDWLQRRTIPVAYIFAHEHAPVVGLHTHINVFIPGEAYRAEFRGWVRNWGTHFVGRHVSRAIRVSGPKIDTPWVHWLKMSYLCKGFDRDCIVQSSRTSPDGREVRLGDLISFAWQDPGPVTLTHRVGVSRSLGPDRRAIGVPTGLDYVLEEKKVTLFGGSFVPPSCQSRIKSFRSRYEDGARDVRVLYGPDFVERVTGLVAESTVDERADDLEPNELVI